MLDLVGDVMQGIGGDFDFAAGSEDLFVATPAPASAPIAPELLMF